MISITIFFCKFFRGFIKKLIFFHFFCKFIGLFMPSVQLSSLNGAQDPAIKSAVLTVEGTEILFHILPLRIAILGARTFFNGKRGMLYEAFYHGFLAEDQRSDHGKLLA